MPKMKVSGIVFLLGMVGAVLVGLLEGLGTWTPPVMLGTIFVVAGIVIGAINVSRGETKRFMISALVIGASAGIAANFPFFPELVGSVFKYISFVALPAGLVVAIKSMLKDAQ